MKERYEQFRYMLLRWGAFHPDEKMNCLKILEKMSPTLRKGLGSLTYQAAVLIEDQKLYIEKLEKDIKSQTAFQESGTTK